MNDTHLSVAKKIGIRPLASRSEAEGLGGKLVQIKPCERYAMDSLTHSIPFLIPQASALLDTIGANFLDSLSCKGLNPNQIIVTSVLRTADDVNVFVVAMEMLLPIQLMLLGQLRCQLPSVL